MSRLSHEPPGEIRGGNSLCSYFILPTPWLKFSVLCICCVWSLVSLWLHPVLTSAESEVKMQSISCWSLCTCDGAQDAESVKLDTHQETRGPLDGLYLVGTAHLPVRTQEGSHREQPPSQARERDTRSTAKVGKGMRSPHQHCSRLAASSVTCSFLFANLLKVQLKSTRNTGKPNERKD